LGPAVSTSASRQTYVTGGAVKAACEAVRAQDFARTQAKLGRSFTDLRLSGGAVVSASEGEIPSLLDVVGDDPFENTLTFRHRATEAIDPETGQAFAHVQYAVAHRAVVDVDVDLGLIKVVEFACTQDVGKAINPKAVIGQIQDGKIKNPSFTDYLIPPSSTWRGAPGAGRGPRCEDR